MNDIYSISVKDIDGNAVSLSDYRGKVLLIVNTASLCGFTPQYSGLEELYKKYKSKGFEVLAFPSNDFGAQEPGSGEEIKEFCSVNYRTTFRIFEKIVVSGPRPHQLYQWLTSGQTNVRYAGPISWNFNKFLIDREGKIATRFDSPTGPMDVQVTQAVEKALM